MLSSKISRLTKILRSSRLLSQNKVDFNNKREFATRHRVWRSRFYDPRIKQKDEKLFGLNGLNLILNGNILIGNILNGTGLKRTKTTRTVLS